MHHSTPHLAMQFDDSEQQRLSATLGMWAFLATEVLFFGGMFAGYTVYRSWYPGTWAAASRHLDLIWGTVNTTVLLGSSLTMALAVHASQTRNRSALMKYLSATILLAIVFLGIKTYEYLHKWHEHLVPGANFQWESIAGESAAGPAKLFFSFYFTMTGFHAFHMVIGIGVLGVLLYQAWRGKFTDGYVTPVANTGLYWHFVDIVWVFLFPLLYLIDRT